MAFWTELNLNRQTATWISHNMIGLVAVAIGLTIGPYLPGPVSLWGAVCGILQALYFGLVREPENKADHQKAGDWKTAGAQAVTPAVDMYGDQVGNWAIGGCALLFFLAEVWAVFPLIFGGLTLALLIVMKVRQVLGKGAKKNAG